MSRLEIVPSEEMSETSSEEEEEDSSSTSYYSEEEEEEEEKTGRGKKKKEEAKWMRDVREAIGKIPMKRTSTQVLKLRERLERGVSKFEEENEEEEEEKRKGRGKACAKRKEQIIRRSVPREEKESRYSNIHHASACSRKRR